jgi:hypothetical protein
MQVRFVSSRSITLLLPVIAHTLYAQTLPLIKCSSYHFENERIEAVDFNYANASGEE